MRRKLVDSLFTDHQMVSACLSRQARRRRRPVGERRV